MHRAFHGMRGEWNMEFLSSGAAALASLAIMPADVNEGRICRFLSKPCPERIVRQIRLKDLVIGMILDEDLVSAKGIRLVPSGAEARAPRMIPRWRIVCGTSRREDTHELRCGHPSQ
jgi:hypothetical protein